MKTTHDQTTQPTSAPSAHEKPVSLAASLRSKARGGASTVVDMAQRHRIGGILAALILVVALGLLALALRRAGRLPGDDLVVEDARTRVAAPAREVGTLDTATPLTVEDVQVVGRTRTATAIDSADARFGASGYATARANVVFSNGLVRAELPATLGYALVDGEWNAIAEPQLGTPTWLALAAPQQDALAAATPALLSMAEQAVNTTKAPVSARTPLAEELAGGTTTIAASEFNADAQSASAELIVEKRGRFVVRRCPLSATFTFARDTGLWTAASAQLDNTAYYVDPEPLIGAWEGSVLPGTVIPEREIAPLRFTVDKNEAGAVAPAGTAVASMPANTARVTGRIAGDFPIWSGTTSFDVPVTAYLRATWNDGQELVAEGDLGDGAVMSFVIGLGTPDDEGALALTLVAPRPREVSDGQIVWDGPARTHRYNLQRVSG